VAGPNISIRKSDDFGISTGAGVDAGDVDGDSSSDRAVSNLTVEGKIIPATTDLYGAISQIIAIALMMTTWIDMD